MATRVLFIDRDGTLIHEPLDNQIDSLAELQYYPLVFQGMAAIARLDFELVMVTNQDALGTPAYPEEAFRTVQQKMIETFAGEGVHFSAVYIDRSVPADNAPTRKPRTGMLLKYIDNPGYDLKNSFVIGDRITDVELARNLGCQAIWLNNGQHKGAGEITASPEELQRHVALETTDWNRIYEFLRLQSRTVSHGRDTKETRISVSLNLDGSGQAAIATGLGFFDHMLEQIARHGNMDLSVQVQGDLHIDEHHTIEDTAITLGEAFALALGDKRGIERYGFCLPMDDCLAQVAVDFGGRSWLVWDAEFKREKVGEMPTEMFYHFFKSFSDAARCNLNIRAEGQNEHHKIEAIFKAFARALKMAVHRDVHHMYLPTTKGVL
jgi:imidazoleglycerol-phosphate dehydratase/histidinol-phosphatase